MSDETIEDIDVERSLQRVARVMREESARLADEYPLIASVLQEKAEALTLTG